MSAARTAPQANNPFIKQLASSDRKTRDRALSSLRAYLSRSARFEPLEFLKLWKGLFFCMWMSDKPLNQQRLARDLADLFTVVKGQENIFGFMDAFWKTMAREWSGIDALRMDKYLYLVRCCLGKGWEILRNHGWEEDVVDRVLEVLEATPLDARDAKIPNGLRHHVVDIYVEELDKVDIEREAPVERILGPLRKLGKETVAKSVRVRVKDALEDERLKDWKGERDGEGESEGASDDAMEGADGGGGDEFGGFDD